MPPKLLRDKQESINASRLFVTGRRASMPPDCRVSNINVARVRINAQPSMTPGRHQCQSACINAKSHLASMQKVMDDKKTPTPWVEHGVPPSMAGTGEACMKVNGCRI